MLILVGYKTGHALHKGIVLACVRCTGIMGGMIALLQGEVVSKGSDSLTLLVGGVGYDLAVPSRDMHRLALGELQTFYVAEQIREDAYDLYGYMEEAEKRLHFKLVTVQGIGPRMAHAILSVYDAATFAEIIEHEDLVRLGQVSGVGKKTAQRMLLDLKGKLVDVASGEGMVSDDPALMALVQLGFSRDQASQSLKNIDSTQPTSERVREALKGIQG